MELTEVISKYLEENRRLVVPALGAFLVKQPDHLIVFSPLLTRDDGVLRALLLDRGISEIEASGMIQRLVFDMRYLVENGGELSLPGLGCFSVDENKALHFCASEPEVSEVAADLSCEEAAEPLVQEMEQPQLFDKPAPTVGEKEQPLLRKSKEFAYSVDPDLKGLAYGGRQKKKISGIDPWLMIGVVAVLLALGVILYGFLRSGARGGAYEPIYEQVDAQ
ncbi:MAG: hypothetical protein SNH94_04330 [Rikenellaceae bacterium]